MHPGENTKKAMPPLGGTIYALPDGVLEHILGFLLAPEAVRTCVLARRWRHLWKSALGLRVGCRYDDVDWIPVEKHREFVEHLLLLHGGSPLDTCEFRFGEFELDDVPRINLWFRHVITCQVRMLTLHAISDRWLELDDLPLASRHLTRLVLRSVRARDSFLNFLGCPSLEHLVIEACELLSANMILPESLKHLTISEPLINLYPSEHSRMHIYATNLVSLCMDGLGGMTPILDRMPALVEACFQIATESNDMCNKVVDPNYPHCDCEFCVTSANIPNGSNYCVLLKGLSEAKHLQLDSVPGMASAFDQKGERKFGLSRDLLSLTV